MARFDNDWNHEREREEERRRHLRAEYERRPPDIGRSNEYGSHAGWGGQGFSQGSFGHYGGQGGRLYTQSGGQGYGASAASGGGMANYSEPGAYRRPGENQDWNTRDEQGRYEREEWRNRNLRDHDPIDRNREEWGRDWGGSGFSGREGGWGGYGGYDRERRLDDRAGDGRDFNRDRGDEWSRFQRGAEWRGTQSWAGGQQRGWASPESRPQGQFIGRGPKGWRRSDDRIREDINERLSDHPDVDASEIEVEVKDCEVTLRGAVDDRRTKRIVEDIAESVSGVVDVQNQLRVDRGFWGSVKDAFSGESMNERPTSAPVHTITPGPETRNQPVTTPRK